MASPAHSLSPPSQQDDIPLFRASKKRKLHQRQRRQSSSSPPPSVILPQDPALPAIEVSDGDHTNIHKLPTSKAVPRRRFASGIEFSGSTSSNQRSKNELLSIPEPTATNGSVQEPLSLSTRFAPSTGTVNRKEHEERYLMAYIDSHLNDTSSAEKTSTSPSTTQQAISSTTNSAISAIKQPAIIGRLQEIDLGPRAARKNEKATLKASLQHVTPGSNSNATTDHVVSDSDSDSSSARKKKKPLPPKIRVNRQGKILPPRRPRRFPQRSEEDVERDRMVEEMLRSEKPANNVSVHESRNGQASERDEELVEQFRREYAENALAAGAGKQSAAGKGSGVGTAIGPKMGGSRSSRTGNQGQGTKGRGR